jgi:tripartite-type tricarboxylate transporter receptor subunit TctC
MSRRSISMARLGILISTLVLATALTAETVRAQPFCPEKVIRLVVPFPAGGPVDSVARLISEPLQQALRQSVIIENRSGASGTVGTGYVAQQPGNGCTILLSYDTHGVNPALLTDLPYDTLKDFKPVMLLGTVSNVLVAHPSNPWKTFDDLVAAAKRRGDIACATGGIGTVAHLSMKVIEQNYGFQLVYVPYRGGASAVQDVMGGHVPLMFGSVLSVSPLVRDGRVRALFQTGTKRDKLLPNVPTLAELGHPELSIVSWVGIFMPASTPDELATRLNEVMATILRDETLLSRLGEIGIQVVASSPPALQSFVESEITRWTDVVKRYDIKSP